MIKLIEAIEALKKDLDIPATLKEVIGEHREAEFMASLDNLAEQVS